MIKERQLSCSDTLENRIVELFEATAEDVYGSKENIPDYDTLLAIAKEAYPNIVKLAKKYNIPIWTPETDNYEV